MCRPAARHVACGSGPGCRRCALRRPDARDVACRSGPGCRRTRLRTAMPQPPTATRLRRAHLPLPCDAPRSPGGCHPQAGRSTGDQHAHVLCSVPARGAAPSTLQRLLLPCFHVFACVSCACAMHVTSSLCRTPPPPRALPCVPNHSALQGAAWAEVYRKDLQYTAWFDEAVAANPSAGPKAATA